MKNLRIGLIGCGGRGYLADHAHKPEQNVFLAAGAEPYPEQRQEFLERCKKTGAAPTLYTDYREMIENEALDGIIITTPDYLHEEHAVFALEHHIPVYLEKPLAISIESADRILETAYRNRTPLVIGHNMRYMAFTRKMKELIDAGTIGDVKAIWCRHFISYGGDAYFRDWHAVKRGSNSLLLQKGAHDIDIIHWLANSRSVLVNGMGNLSIYDKLPRRPENAKRPVDYWSESHWPPQEQRGMFHEIEVEDLNMIQMRLANGVLASYEQCHYTPDAWRNYTVIGTKGRLENYGDYAPGSEIQLWSRRKDAFRLEGDATFRVGGAEGTHGGADELIIQSFLDALRGKYEVWSTPQAARHSVAAGCCGADSIRNGGRPETVPPLPEHLENWNFTRATGAEK